MIRYDSKFKREIRKIVNNYNAKINRLENSGINLPEKIDKNALDSLKSSVNSRAELRRRLKDLQEFTKRGGEKTITIKGNEIQKYQYENIKRYRRIISRRLSERQKFVESTRTTTEGIPSQFTIAQQFDEETQNIKALRESLIDVDYFDMTSSELNRYLSKLQLNSRTINLSVWQKNYADMLLETGYVYNLPHNDLMKLREKILSLNAKQFDKLFKTEATVKQILYYYSQINELGVDLSFQNMEADVTSIYKSLFDNIDDIIKDYQ